MLITKIYLICVHTLCNDVVSPHCWWSKTSWICFHKHCNSMASLRHDFGSFCGMAIWISGHTPYNGKAFLLCGSFCVMSIWISGHTPYNGKAFLLCGSFHVPLQSESVATHLTMERFSPVWILSCVLAIRICCHTPYNHKVSLLCGSFHVSWPFESIATHLTMVSFLSWVSHLLVIND